MNNLVNDVIQSIINRLLQDGDEIHEDTLKCFNSINPSHEVFDNKTFENFAEVKNIIIAFDDFNVDTNNFDFDFFVKNELTNYIEIIKSKLNNDIKTTDNIINTHSNNYFPNNYYDDFEDYSHFCYYK